jgi:hypothetical protein
VLPNCENIQGEEGAGGRVQGHTGINSLVTVEPHIILHGGVQTDRDVETRKEGKSGKHFKRKLRSAAPSDEKLGVFLSKKRGVHMEIDEGEVEKQNKQKGEDGNATNLKNNAGCRNSPARPNEDRGVELSGFGEWPGNSFSSGTPEDGGPRHSFSL